MKNFIENDTGCEMKQFSRLYLQVNRKERTQMTESSFR